MNKRKVSFMLITMFVTSSIFSGCFVPYSTQYNREVATALNYARAEVSQDSDSLYAYLNTTITRESSEESENPDDTEQVEGTIPPSDDSSGDGSESGEGEDSEGPSVDEGGSSKPPSNDEVAIPPTIEGDTTPPTGSDGDTSQTPPESGGDQQPSEPTVTNQSQVQIVKSTGSSELVGAGESYTPYGTIELSLKLSGKILESKIDIPVTPEQPDDGTGEGDIDDGEDENKPSEGGTDDGSGDSSGEDSDKPSNGDGEQKPPIEDGGNKPDEGEGIPDNGVNGTPDVGEEEKPEVDGGSTDQPSDDEGNMEGSSSLPPPQESPSEPTKPPTDSEDSDITDDVEDTEEEPSTYGVKNFETGTLGDLIKRAYQEAKGDRSSETVTERKKLRDALSKILDDMNAQLSFESTHGVKKIKMSSDFVPNTDDYIKSIIDLGNTKLDNGIDPSNIALRIVVRNENVGDKLLTNTVYSLGALEESQTNRDITVGDDVKLTLTGLSNCKTGKAPALFISKNAAKPNLYETNSQNLQGTSKNDMYVTQFKNGVYLDMGSYGTSESDISIAENSIKFKNITFRDPDRSISRVEIQDDRGYRYSCSLISEYTDTFSIEVNGLESDTSYIFTKLFITSNTDGRITSQELDLGCYDNGSVKQNYIPIRTIKQPEPKIQLAATNSSTVKLPNGIEMNTVKNSDTALRYVFKVDNKQGNILDLKVISLTGSESYQVEKIVDRVQKQNYYIVTLNNLEKNKDYGFVILELNYLDDSGNVQTSRKSLSTLNSTKGENIKYDNMTEAESLPIEEAVQILLSDSFTSSYARVARVPILIDDLENRVTSIDVENPVDNPNARVSYDNFILEFSDLKPETSGMFTIIFNCEDNGVSRETKQIKKYVQLSTTETPDYDIKSTDIEVVDLTKVNIKLNIYNNPKSEVKSVTVLDDLNNALKATWDKDISTIKLEGLKPDYTYTNVIIRLILENGKSVEYPLGTFKTVIDENRPKGDVAEFVRRVYKIALGREPENEGWNFWIEKLQSKELSATEFIAENLMTQPEFVDRELTKSKFVSTMYTLIVDRESEEEGQKYWESKYVEYRDQVSTIEQLRIKIAREMMDQPEFKELVTRIGLRY